ncbi:MAG TPA: hypothetical protein VFS92_10145 [Planctomycetota bacterium]|nr:hypothetical protein [Planctomycetota bacterium]
MECTLTAHPNTRPQGPCRHPRLTRIGIQESPFEPFRLYLVTCRDCGTTISTKTLRREDADRDAG